MSDGGYREANAGHEPDAPQQPQQLAEGWVYPTQTQPWATPGYPGYRPPTPSTSSAASEPFAPAETSATPVPPSQPFNSQQPSPDHPRHQSPQQTWDQSPHPSSWAPPSQSSWPPQSSWAPPPVSPPPPAQRPPTRRRHRNNWIVAVLVCLLFAFSWMLQANNRHLPGTAPAASPTQTGLAPTGSAPPSPKPGSTPTNRSTPAFTSVSPHAVEVTAAAAVGVVLVEGALANSENAYGTGMVIDPSGIVLTNYHVVRDTRDLQATIVSTGIIYSATVLGHDASADIAVLQLNGASELRTVTLDPSQPQVGEQLTSVGNARGRGTLVGTTGQLTEINTRVQIASEPYQSVPGHTIEGVMLANTSAEPGYSGGPTFNNSNQVVGITTAGSASTNTPATYIIPIGHAQKVADQILAGDQSGTVRIGPRAYLGVTPRTSGNLLILTVGPDSPAADAGLQAGDVITGLDNNTTSVDWTTLVQVLETKDPSDHLQMTWTHAGAIRRADVVLATNTRN